MQCVICCWVLLDMDSLSTHNKHLCDELYFKTEKDEFLIADFKTIVKS